MGFGTAGITLFGQPAVSLKYQFFRYISESKLLLLIYQFLVSSTSIYYIFFAFFPHIYICDTIQYDMLTYLH